MDFKIGIVCLNAHLIPLKSLEAIYCSFEQSAHWSDNNPMLACNVIGYVSPCRPPINIKVLLQKVRKQPLSSYNMIVSIKMLIS